MKSWLHNLQRNTKINKQFKRHLKTAKGMKSVWSQKYNYPKILIQRKGPRLISVAWLCTALLTSHRKIHHFCVKISDSLVEKNNIQPTAIFPRLSIWLQDNAGGHMFHTQRLSFSYLLEACCYSLRKPWEKNRSISRISLGPVPLPLSLRICLSNLETTLEGHHLSWEKKTRRKNIKWNVIGQLLQCRGSWSKAALCKYVWRGPGFGALFTQGLD